MIIINSKDGGQKRKKNANRITNGNGNKKDHQEYHRRRKGENNNKKERLAFSEELVDKCAQYVISEYYFSSSDVDYSDEYDDEDGEDGDEFDYPSDLEQGSRRRVYFSEDESADGYYGTEEDCESEAEDGDYYSGSSSSSICSDLEDALAMKVDSVIGPAAWNFFGGGSGHPGGAVSSDEADGEDLFCFDDDGTDCLIELPIPTPPPESSCSGGGRIYHQQQTSSHQQASWSDQMAILTPQVLAAISAAAKTLNSGHSRRHLEYIRAQAEGRDAFSGPLPPSSSSSSKLSSFNSQTQNNESTTNSPNTNTSDDLPQTDNPLKRWSRIPISAFRRRRPSLGQPVLPMNAIRQMSVDSGMADSTLLSEPKPSSSAMIITIEEAAAAAAATGPTSSLSSSRFLVGRRGARINSVVTNTCASSSATSSSAPTSAASSAGNEDGGLPRSLMMLGSSSGDAVASAYLGEATWTNNSSQQQSQYYCCYYSTDLDGGNVSPIGDLDNGGFFLLGPAAHHDMLLLDGGAFGMDDSSIVDGDVFSGSMGEEECKETTTTFLIDHSEGEDEDCGTIHIELGHVHICDGIEEDEDHDHDDSDHHDENANTSKKSGKNSLLLDEDPQRPEVVMMALP